MSKQTKNEGKKQTKRRIILTVSQTEFKMKNIIKDEEESTYTPEKGTINQKNIKIIIICASNNIA